MQRDYHGFIFSTHALERLKDRSISQDAVARVLQSPEITKPGDKPGSTKFIKTINDRRIHVVATYLTDQKKWLIVSVWVRGEDDAVPLVWTLLTWPFTLCWRLLKFMVKRLLKHSA